MIEYAERLSDRYMLTGEGGTWEAQECDDADADGNGKDRGTGGDGEAIKDEGWRMKDFLGMKDEGHRMKDLLPSSLRFQSRHYFVFHLLSLKIFKQF